MINIPLQAIIFDFDGTLAKLNLDFDLMQKALLDLISSYGISSDGFEGLYLLETIEAGKQLISQYYPGKDTEFVKKANSLISDIETEQAEKGELFDGVRDMLADLKKRNMKIGVATRNCLSAVKKVYPDIDSYCDTIVTRENTTKAKPHPEHVLLTLKALDAEARHAAMVGDHPMDILSGKRAGTYTIGVLTGSNRSDLLLEAGADIVIDRVTDILDHLQ